ncbi:hypothetical protein FUAX_49670 (plasmid) [Fulvitalea axinellae]|uniref:Uncharacterized protein n=1 Tax=Fulvitalea axinellae TaxID=1182444 RepID=A0AAU9DMW6_9BACT|nr:hypothetical protein FUAX_49670 [Fulvitalea axinellae]
MKHMLFLTLACCLLPLGLRAEAVEGLIFFERQIKRASFDIPTESETGEIRFELLQHKVRYYDEWGNKQILKPKQAREYRFTFKGKEIRMISVSRKAFPKKGTKPPFAKTLFLRCVEDGAVRLLEYHRGSDINAQRRRMLQQPARYFKNAGPGQQPLTKGRKEYILFKDQEVLVLDATTTKSHLDLFLSDCPNIQEKATRQTDTEDTATLAVRLYNENCGVVKK